MKNLLLVLLCCLCSCSTLNNKNSYHFPQDIKTIAINELQNAKSCIENKGLKLKDKGVTVKIIKIDGTRKINGEWLFVNPYAPNQIIYGFIDYNNNVYYVHVACNPKTKNEISPKTLKHEFGHFWLMSNKNDWSHNPLYTDCFADWRNYKIFISSNETIKIINETNETNETNEINEINEINHNCIYHNPNLK